MRAVIYSRVSSDEQVKGYSLPQQYDESLELIQRRGYTFMELYEDDGYSAKDMNRPALKRMLADLHKKKFDMIVVWNTDRLSRDLIDGLTMVKRTFNPNGIKFISVTEDIDTSTPDGMMMLAIRLTFAQRERERNGERVTMGLAKKASTGRRVSLGAIYGYETVNGELKVNKYEAEVVNRIFNLYVYKNWGYAKIAKTLNAEKVPSKTSSTWWPNTIKGMLKNSTYVGINAWTPGEQATIVKDGEHDAIISMELFELTRTKLERKGNLEMSRSSYSYPFSSIIKCGNCGSSYTAYYTKKPNDRKPYCNYRCAGKKSQDCSSPDIAEFKLERLFFDYFSTFYLDMHDYTPEPTKEAQKDVEKDRKRIDKELDKLKRRKTNLLEDLGDRIISREDYRKAMVDVEHKMQLLQAELEMLVPTDKADSKKPSEVFEFIRGLKNDWDYMTHEDRKYVIQMMFKKIIIHKEQDEWTIKEVDPA